MGQKQQLKDFQELTGTGDDRRATRHYGLMRFMINYGPNLQYALMPYQTVDFYNINRGLCNGNLALRKFQFGAYETMTFAASDDTETANPYPGQTERDWCIAKHADRSDNLMLDPKWSNEIVSCASTEGFGVWHSDFLKSSNLQKAIANRLGKETDDGEIPPFAGGLELDSRTRSEHIYPWFFFLYQVPAKTPGAVGMFHVKRGWGWYKPWSEAPMSGWLSEALESTHGNSMDQIKRICSAGYMKLWRTHGVENVTVAIVPPTGYNPGTGHTIYNPNSFVTGGEWKRAQAAELVHAEHVHMELRSNAIRWLNPCCLLDQGREYIRRWMDGFSHDLLRRQGVRPIMLGEL